MIDSYTGRLNGYDSRVNYIVVKEGNEDAPWIEALRECLNREETKKFIEDTYQGSVVLALDAEIPTADAE